MTEEEQPTPHSSTTQTQGTQLLPAPQIDAGAANTILAFHSWELGLLIAFTPLSRRRISSWPLTLTTVENAATLFHRKISNHFSTAQRGLLCNGVIKLATYKPHKGFCQKPSPDSFWISSLDGSHMTSHPTPILLCLMLYRDCYDMGLCEP